MKPYVVSADIYLLLKKWADKAGFILPSPLFFKQLRKEFHSFVSNIFGCVEMVPEEELASGIKALVSAYNLPAISLDRVYLHSDLTLEITRQVDSELQNCGLGRRADAPSVKQQFAKLRQSGIKKAIIVDDVIFTGDLIKRVGKILEAMGINIVSIVAGIGIGEGVTQLESLGFEVKCVRLYKEVIDEICERDFYPGVPLSGRMLHNDGNVGFPYILPFGDPVQWASIPEDWTESFSSFCISQSIKLFEAIGIASGMDISCADLERKVFGLPQDNQSYVRVLRQLL